MELDGTDPISGRVTRLVLVPVKFQPKRYDSSQIPAETIWFNRNDPIPAIFRAKREYVNLQKGSRGVELGFFNFGKGVHGAYAQN